MLGIATEELAQLRQADLRREAEARQAMSAVRRPGAWRQWVGRALVSAGRRLLGPDLAGLNVTPRSTAGCSA